MKTKIFYSVLLLVAVFCGVYMALQSDNVVGSTVIGGEYHATTTSTMGAGKFQVIGLPITSHALAQSSTTLQTLGSIVVASSSATSLTVWDATSTRDVSSTTIAILKASVGENTYTYDVAIKRGLVIWLPTGYNGAYTITYR